jgi:hypothetical protein
VLFPPTAFIHVLGCYFFFVLVESVDVTEMVGVVLSKPNRFFSRVPFNDAEVPTNRSISNAGDISKSYEGVFTDRM